jgi:hypothetical protein
VSNAGGFSGCMAGASWYRRIIGHTNGACWEPGPCPQFVQALLSYCRATPKQPIVIYTGVTGPLKQAGLQKKSGATA